MLANGGPDILTRREMAGPVISRMGFPPRAPRQSPEAQDRALREEVPRAGTRDATPKAANIAT